MFLSLNDKKEVIDYGEHKSKLKNGAEIIELKDAFFDSYASKNPLNFRVYKDGYSITVEPIKSI